MRWAGSGGRGREGGGTVTNPSKSEKKAGGGSVGEPFQSDGTSVHDGRRGGGGEGEAHRHPPGLDQVDQGAAGYDAAPISNCAVAGWRAATQPVRSHRHHPPAPITTSSTTTRYNNNQPPPCKSLPTPTVT